MMLRRRRRTGDRKHTGGVLFEILLAIALFAGAAAFALGALRSAFASLERARQLQLAIDLARTKMAELEAGLINLADLQGDLPLANESSIDNGNAGTADADGGFLFDVKTHRTEFAGLSLVELTVRENVPNLAAANPLQYTLRQLMPLREIESEEYEADEISEGGG